MILLAKKAVFLVSLFFALTNSQPTGYICDPPEVISTFPELECSIISSELNLQSLLQAFFPANRLSALVVEVQFYINATGDNGSPTVPQHPILPGANSNLEPLPDMYQYIFRWLASPALLYGDPKVLEGLSARAIAIDYQYAPIVIAPFKEGNKDFILNALNNATIWMKSYTIRKKSSYYEGKVAYEKGYASYKQNISTDDFFVYGQESEYHFYIIIMSFSIFSLEFFCAFLVPLEIDRNYEKLHNRASKPIRFNQRYSFKSIMWAFICISFWIVLFFLGIDFYHYRTFGSQWNSQYQVFYPMIIGTGVSLAVISIIACVIVVYRAYKNNNLLPLPYLIEVLFCLKCSCTCMQDKENKEEEMPENVRRRWYSYNTLGLLFWQFFAIFVITAVISFSAFHLCGVLLAVLANPAEVIASGAIFLAVALCGVFAFAYIFEKSEDLLGYYNRGKKAVRFFAQIVVFTTIIMFVIGYGYTYITVTLFIGDDSTTVISPIIKLVPLLVLTVVTWLMKRELEKYGDSEYIPEVRQTQQIHAVNQIPMDDVAGMNSLEHIPYSLPPMSGKDVDSEMLYHV